MKLHFNNTSIDIPASDDSYRYRGIMKEHALTVKFLSSEFLEIPVGAYTDFGGERYELMSPENFRKNGTRRFEYTLILESGQSRLKKYRFRDVTSKKLKFSLTGKPEMHLKFLVDNLNKRESGWAVGEVLDATEKVLSYNHIDCFAAMNMIANEFETEWEVVGKTIHIRKVEYNKTTPLPLSYGKGNGFKPGVGRANSQESNPVEILFVQGGTRNIDRAKYGHPELLLPAGQTLKYDGRTYSVDAEGFSLQRSDKPLQAKTEDSLDCSHFYPSRVGTISSVIIVDAPTSADPAGKFYDFIDSGIPDDLDYSKHVIAGEKATIIFQDGMLAGKEFDLMTDDEGNLSGYVHAERRFKIVSQEMDGMTMPNNVFIPSVGGKYAVFGISMPDAYIRNDATQSGASWEMLKEGARYLRDHEDPRFQFTGELDGIYAKNNWGTIEGKIRLGSYILFSDASFQPQGVLIRIIGIKEFVNDRYSPTIELSNVSVTGSFTSELKKIGSNEVLSENRFNDSIRFTKRTWRDAYELFTYLQNSMLNFDSAINPIAVHTMQLLVGDNSLQFRYVNNTTNPVEIDHTFVYNDNTKELRCQVSLIQHMTLGIDTMSPGHKPAEYKFWQIAALNYKLQDAEARWVYLKCSKTMSGNLGTGEVVLSKTAIKMEQVGGYYHFLVAFLNSEYDNERSFVTMYGFTEITPGQIRVNKIINPDGLQFWDMLLGRFRIGNSNSFISYNNETPNQVVLKGTIYQSPAGDTDYPEIDRGMWVSGRTYYPGDKVKYTDGSIYKCYVQTSAAPTNASYWKLLVAKGDPGTNGSPGSPGANGIEGVGYMYAYYPSNLISAPSRPGGVGGSIPSGWYGSAKIDNYRYLYRTQSIKSGGYWGSWSNPELYNYVPPPGDPGPAIVFRGLWEQITPTQFYNNAARRDVIATSWNRYYIFKGNDGETLSSGQSWVWETKWQDFGAQFSSVATNLLLAENANIAGWVFKNGRMESQTGGAYMDGRDGGMMLGNGRNYFYSNGAASLASGNIRWDASGNISIGGIIHAYGGLATASRIVTGATYLTAKDHFIIVGVNVSSAITLYLPEAGVPGLPSVASNSIRVKNMSASHIFVKCSNYETLINKGGRTSVAEYKINSGGEGYFYGNSGYWYVM